jgi:glycoside hydrolase-like protein
MAVLRSSRRVLLTLLVFVVAQVVAGFPNMVPAAQAYGHVSQKKGFDTCAAPSASTMQTWWTSSPYWNIGIYIGGSNRGCSQPNLTASWITTVQNQGWGLLPIWVGPQMKYPDCQGRQYNSYISLNTSTAYNQGYDQAFAAYSAAGTLGFDRTSMPIVYDLEGYNGNSTCRAAAKSFMNGWDTYLHVPPAQKAGVYGSACSSYINDFAGIANVPDFIWFAWWNGNPSTKNITCINSGYWIHNQRHKQYVGGHNETYGGKTINIDNDCSDGPVYYPYDRFDSSSPCV